MNPVDEQQHMPWMTNSDFLLLMSILIAHIICHRMMTKLYAEVWRWIMSED